MILGIADHPSFKTSIEEFLNFASEVKVEVVEIKLDRMELLSFLHSPSSSKKDKVKKLLDCHDFKYSVHAPYIGVNLASLNPSIRKASEKLIAKTVDFAHEINAELVVTHVGRLSKDYPIEFVEKSMNNAITSLRRVKKRSEDFGLILTIENDHKAEDYVLAGDVQQIAYLINKIDCKLTFDVGHANTFGNLEEYARVFSEYIVNIHLHDNNGQEDNHLPLGRGNVNFEEIIKAIGVHVDSPIVLECHSLKGIKESLNLLNRT